MTATFKLRLRDGSSREFLKPSVMGVINMSPNSFYKPCLTIESALKSAEEMVKAGADFVDIGGEATNPLVNLETSAPTAQQELDRVIPVVETLAKEFDILISVDTSQAVVMEEAIKKGAALINDQRGLKNIDCLNVVKKWQVPVCLMHFFDPLRQAGSSHPADLLKQVKNELSSNVQRCQSAGLLSEQIIIDPGFGGGNYGKNTAENFYLLAHLESFLDLKLPLLVAWSRKSMIGEALNGAPVENRLYGSIAAATMAAARGASIVRTHDVKETMDALQIVRRTMYD